VRDTLAARGDGADDTGHLPLVDVAVFLNGFGREEGTAAPGALRKLVQSCFGGVIEAT
jgi:hypothetical protein